MVFEVWFQAGEDGEAGIVGSLGADTPADALRAIAVAVPGLGVPVASIQDRATRVEAWHNDILLPDGPNLRTRLWAMWAIPRDDPQPW